MTIGSVNLTNPYIGPRRFEQEESRFFFGRDEEIKILSGLVIAHQLSLFYAQSGAGKSSLLRAGLLPRLTSKTRVGRGTDAYLYQTMQVLPIVTVGRGVPPSTDVAIQNIFSFSAQLDLLPTANPNELAERSLVDSLVPLLDDGIAPGAVWESAQKRDGRTRPRLIKPDATLLIIDQFEEIFTVHPERGWEREAFFRQVTAALKRFPTLHILFTMREDYLAELTPYANLLIDDLRNRYRMQRLRREGALLAVTQPALAGNPSRTFAPGVAEKLVDNLRRIQRSQRSQRLAPVAQAAADGAAQIDLAHGEYVEPVHLQIVCRDLWAALPEEREEIQESDLVNLGDVDQALINFYENTLKTVVDQTDVSQRALRRWFNEELITPARTKGLIYRDEGGETAGLANAAVDILSAVWLIRSDLRGGDTWYELAHDRLIEPILTSNSTWLHSQNELFRSAQEWDENNRRAALLYDRSRLNDALKNVDVELHDQLILDFVAASRAQIAAQSLKRRLAWMGIAAMVLLGITVIIFGLWRTTRKALVETAVARDSVQRIRIATESLLQSESAPQRGLLLAVEATNLYDPATNRAEPQAFQALYKQFRLWQYWQQTNVEHTQRVNVIQFDSGTNPVAGLDVDSVLFSAAADGRLLRWDITTEDVKEMLSLNVPLSAFALHSATRQIVIGTEQGELLLGSSDSTFSTIQRWQGYGKGQRVSATVFTPDGGVVISGGGNGQIRFWQTANVSKPITELSLSAQERCQNLCRVNTLAISNDGRWLAAGGWNKRLTLWRIDQGEQPVEILNEDFIDTVWAATFSPDSKWLMAGDGAGNLRRYRLDDTIQGIPQVVEINVVDLVDIRSLAFSPIAPLVAVGDGNGVVGMLAIEELTPTLKILGRMDNVTSKQPINTVAFNPTGTLVASGGMDGSVRLWQLAATKLEPAELYQHSQRIRALSLYPGALFEHQPPEVNTLISAGEDETVQFWSMRDPPVHLGTIHEAGNRILATAIHPAGTWLATGGRDGHLRLYPLTGAIPDTPLLLGSFAGEILTVAFSPSGDLLAAAGSEQVIRIWSLPDLTALPLKLNNDSIILALAFNRAGTQLVSGDERLVKRWNLLQSPPSVDILYTHNDWVWSVAFSPDERFLASVSADSMVHLAPLDETALAQGPTFAHEQRARALAFSPDGNLLATAGDDQLIRLWDPDRLDKPLAEFAGHRGAIWSLVFRSNGKQLLSAGADGIIRQWTVDLATLQAMACARTGRNLLPNEWELYFPSTPYHATCLNRQ